MNTPEEKYCVDFERSMEQYSDMIYRIALTITGNDEDAKDVFQETFLRLVRYQHRITGEEHLKAWLIRVATNCAKTTAASPWNRRTQGMDAEPKSEVSVDDRENENLLTELQRLPGKYSVVLYLYYYEGYSVKEIALMLKKKENSVKTLLSRGRELLKKHLMEGGNSHE